MSTTVIHELYKSPDSALVPLMHKQVVFPESISAAATATLLGSKSTRDSTNAVKAKGVLGVVATFTDHQVAMRAAADLLGKEKCEATLYSQHASTATVHKLTPAGGTIVERDAAMYGPLPNASIDSLVEDLNNAAAHEADFRKANMGSAAPTYPAVTYPFAVSSIGRKVSTSRYYLSGDTPKRITLKGRPCIWVDRGVDNYTIYAVWGFVRYEGYWSTATADSGLRVADSISTVMGIVESIVNVGRFFFDLIVEAKFAIHTNTRGVTTVLTKDSELLQVLDQNLTANVISDFMLRFEQVKELMMTKTDNRKAGKQKRKRVDSVKSMKKRKMLNKA